MTQAQVVKKVKEIYKDSLLIKPNVVGVGTGYKVIRGRKTDQLCIVTLVRQKIPVAGLPRDDRIPPEINGVSTDVIQVGQIRALNTHKDRFRPAPGGVSLGHYQVTAGTLGVVVKDLSTDGKMILSNNHVLAQSNQASIGDPILQPGAIDGGLINKDTIAHLERFAEIKFSSQGGDCDIARSYVNIGNTIARVLGSQHRLESIRQDPSAVNRVDAAIARPVEDDVVTEDILGIGTITGATEAELSMLVRKSGRTTSVTSGEVIVVEATVDVEYGSNRLARFEGQIVTTAMSQGGDSGSLLVAEEMPKAVGLLFAGSDEVTIHNAIQDVFSELGVEL